MASRTKSTEDTIPLEKIIGRLLEEDWAAGGRDLSQRLARYKAEFPAHARQLESCFEIHRQLAVSLEPVAEPVPTFEPGSTFGPYTIVERLGKGGMGHVYRARRRNLATEVALKMSLDRAADARLGREGRAGSRFVGPDAHPNVVPVYESGIIEGIRYIAMELVEGTDFHAVVEALNRRGALLPIHTACEYIQQAARGLAHAHRRDVLHRDVKPSNLLLTRDGTVRLSDFGLARIIEVGRQTQSLTGVDVILGSLPYMSFEQIEDSHTTDARSDIYGLGGCLFFLLTGEEPLSAIHTRHSNVLDGPVVIDLDEEEEESRAERLEALPPGLRWVVAKMLAHDPDDRFQSADEVVEALEPYCRRPRVVTPRRAAAAGVLGCVLAVASLGWGPGRLSDTPAAANETKTSSASLGEIPDDPFREPEKPTGDAPVEDPPPSENRYVATIRGAYDAWRSRRFDQARSLLEKAAVEDRGWEWWFLRHLAATTEKPEELEPKVEDGRQVKGLLETGGARDLGNVQGWLWNLAFSPDGKWLAAGGGEGKLHVWDVAAGKHERELAPRRRGDSPFVQGVVFTPDGKAIVATYTNCDIRRWGLANGVDTLVSSGGTANGHTRAIHGVALDSKRDRLFTTSDDHGVRVWNARTMRLATVFEGHASPVQSVAVRAKDGLVATGDDLGHIKVWTVQPNRVRHDDLGKEGERHSGAVAALAFSPDGRFLVSGSDDKTVGVWDVESGGRVATPREHTAAVRGVAFSADGRRLVTSGWDDSIRIWETKSYQEILALPGPGGLVAFSPDDTLLVTGGGDPVAEIRLWKAPRESGDQARK